MSTITNHQANEHKSPLKYQSIRRVSTNKTKSKRSHVLEGMWGQLESLLVSESVKAQALWKTQHGTTPKQTNKQTKQNRMSINGNEQEEARRKKGGRLYDLLLLL